MKYETKVPFKVGDEVVSIEDFGELWRGVGVVVKIWETGNIRVLMNGHYGGWVPTNLRLATKLEKALK